MNIKTKEIGIIGSGNIGGALTRYLTRLGHKVSVANSRGPSSLTELAKETGATAVTVDEAAKAKDIVIISIPFMKVLDLPKNIFANTKAIIVDTGNWFPARDGQNPEIENGVPDSEWVSKVIGHDVIKAFNNIVTDSFVSKAQPHDSKNRVALAVSGNNPEERRVVMELINDIGFDAVDNGSLSESWRHQPGSPAYCKDLSAIDLKEALQKNEKHLVPGYRAQENQKVIQYLESMNMRVNK